MRMRLLSSGIALLVCLSPLQLYAQLKPELFGHVGTFRGGTDEGRIGMGASFGGTITIPVHRRLAADLDIQTAKVARIWSSNSFYKTRRTLILANLLYRWAGPRAYGFVGAGVGTEFGSHVNREDNFLPDYTPVGWQEIMPRVFEIQRSHTGRILFAPRVGFAVFPKRGLGIRADFYLANWHTGAKIGVGYRFN